MALILGASCSTPSKNQPYNTPAHRATNKGQVSVKVSLKNRMIYVKEGNRTLLTTPTAIGTPSNPTPTGNFRTFNRLPRKRSNTYGFHIHPSGNIVPGKRSNMPRGARYVG